MFVTLSPVSYGGNWSSCQKQKDKNPEGVTVVVSEVESITFGPISICVGAKALILDKACLLTKGEERDNFDC